MRRHARGAAALGVSVLALASMLVPQSSATEAAFTDPERAQADISAATLQPPQFTGIPLCRAVLLGGDVLSMTWRLPSGEAYDGFTTANVQWSLAGSAWEALPSSGPDGNGLYTTTFSQGLLSGLLGSLLGGNFTAQIRTVAGTNWSSASTSALIYDANLLGVLFPPTCSYQNG